MKKLLNKEFLFFSFVFLLLASSYALNIFKIADDNYRLFDRSSEAFVIGRIMASRDEGILSKGGLPGYYKLYNYKLKENDEIPNIISFLPNGDMSKIGDLKFDIIARQKLDDFINDRKIEGIEWNAYKTQPGGQILIYVILDHILPLNGGNKLIIFRLLTLILNVLVLLLFVKWIYNNWGFGVSLITFMLIFISPWFFRFSYNLWWALWSFYIPFLTMLFVLDRKRKNHDYKIDRKIYGLFFFTVLIKFFFSGAEFISSTLVMAVCPLIYHLIITKAGFKSSIFHLFKSSVACILGVLAGMFLLIVQIRISDGSWMAGFEHIFISFIKRSAYGETSEQFKVLDVFLMYFKGEVFYYQQMSFVSVSFGMMFLIISLLSIFIYFYSRKLSPSICMSNRALVLTVAISVLGPLSWVVIFSEHAYSHYMIDYIVWYMPYLLYSYAIIGIAINLLVNALRKRGRSVISIK